MRLVAKGFHQRPGLNYTQTFSVVIKPATVHLVLSIALYHQWVIRQLDVIMLFLHGHLKKVVFMAQKNKFISSSNPRHGSMLYTPFHVYMVFMPQNQTPLFSSSIKVTF